MNLALVAPISRTDDGPLQARSASDLVPFLQEEINDVTVLRVERSLLPLTAYEICAGSGPCVPVVTGEASDEEPTDSVSASLTETHGLFEFERECGGPVNATVVVIEADRPGGAVAMVMHRRIDDTSVLVTLQPLFSDEPIVGLVDHASEGGRADYEISAIDLGGNVSEPTVVPADLGCGGSCSTGGSNFPLAVIGLAFLRRERRRTRQPLHGVSARREPSFATR